MPKNSVFENEYTFFSQNNEMYVKEDYQYLSPFKKCIPTKTSMPKKFSVRSFIHFFQPIEVNVWENKYDYQFSSPFKKGIPTKTSMPKSFSV